MSMHSSLLSQSLALSHTHSHTVRQTDMHTHTQRHWDSTQLLKSSLKAIDNWMKTSFSSSYLSLSDSFLIYKVDEPQIILTMFHLNRLFLLSLHKRSKPISPILNASRIYLELAQNISSRFRSKTSKTFLIKCKTDYLICICKNT